MYKIEKKCFPIIDLKRAWDADNSVYHQSNYGLFKQLAPLKTKFLLTWKPNPASPLLFHLKWCRWQEETLWSQCSRSHPCRTSWRCGRRSPWHCHLGNTGCRSSQRRLEWAFRWGSLRWNPCTTPAIVPNDDSNFVRSDEVTGTWMVSSSYLVLAFKNITSSFVSLPALEPPCPILLSLDDK